MPYTPAWQQTDWQHTNAAPAATPAAGAAPPATTPPQGAPPQQQGIIGQNPGPGMQDPLHQWSSWMYSGGVNPNAWQNTGGTDPSNWMGLGGGPNLGFLDQANQSLANGANPTSVAPTDANSLFGAGQSYNDAAYQQATRELDPQWAQQESQFNQQMVNQGLAPGSAAYNTAKANFDQSKNDAYSQARSQAMQQGLSAQAQGFGQGLSQSQLASQLQQALLGSQTSMTNQQLGGNASITNAMLGGNQALMQSLLGGNSNIAQQLIGGQATRDASNAGARASMYGSDRSHDIGQQNTDNQLLEWMLNGGAGVTSYNNNNQQQQFNNNYGFMQNMPSGGGGSGIDVQSPYNNQFNANMNQWGYQNQQADAQNNMYANLAMGFLMCSHEFKETVGPLSPKKALEAVRSLPVDRWRYKGQPEVHVGTYAEDFNKALDLPEKPVISVIDLLGTLLGAVKELAQKVDHIDARLAVAGVQ